MSEENKSMELMKEQLGAVAGGKDDEKEERGAVICPQCRVKNYPAYGTIKDERRFACWRCGYSRDLTDEEVDRILRGQGMSW